MTQYPKIRFIFKTLHHKWYVLRYGIKVKAPIWRLIIHDWTKFLPPELPAYAERLYGETFDEIRFAQAWNHHHKANAHHWEYHIPLTSHSKSSIPGGVPLPMPEWAAREMVADWLGASASYAGQFPTKLSEWTWHNNNRHKVRVHPDTSALIDQVIEEYFSSLKG